MTAQQPPATALRRLERFYGFVEISKDLKYIDKPHHVEHIPHFINQWTAMSVDNFWYAKLGVEQFVEISLSEVRRNGHDLHWHSYSADTLRQTVEAAFWFSRRGARFLLQERSVDHHHYLVVEGAAATGAMPAFLAEHAQQLTAAARRIENLG